MVDRALPQTEQTRRPAADAGLLPPGLLARVPLPPELVQAIVGVLDRLDAESSGSVREELLLRSRSALQAWLRGRVTAAQAASTMDA
jgi:hypothetical protein